jgi:uncharacterized membrane protein YfcA
MLVAIGMMAGGIAAGTFGSLLGLGGGILIVPLLTLGFDLPVREAVGASLVAVIMTSGASAAVYLERHVANLRLGMTLEMFTAFGALLGGLVAFLLDEQVLAGLFTILLVYTAISMARGRGGADPEAGVELPPIADPPTFTDTLGGPGYRIRHLPGATVGSVFAGVVSALLGVGGGLVKVPIMHLGMGVPLRVATATSNLMIGITASAGAIVYLMHGGIDPYVAGPTAVGVFVGASVGSRMAHRIDTRVLRILFVVVLLYTAFLMGRKALGI